MKATDGQLNKTGTLVGAAVGVIVAGLISLAWWLLSNFTNTPLLFCAPLLPIYVIAGMITGSLSGLVSWGSAKTPFEVIVLGIASGILLGLGVGLISVGSFFVYGAFISILGGIEFMAMMLWAFMTAVIGVVYGLIYGPIVGAVIGLITGMIGILAKRPWNQPEPA